MRTSLIPKESVIVFDEELRLAALALKYDRTLPNKHKQYEEIINLG